MPSIINSDNGVVSGSAGLKTTGASDGVTAFQQNGTESMRIDSSGNVGIGATPNGSYKLQVNGQINGTSASITGANSGAIYVQDSNTAFNPQIQFIGTNRTFQLGTGNSASGFNNQFFIYDGTAAATRMLIDSSGNVGVNNSNPSQYATSGKILNITGTANNTNPAAHFMQGSSSSLGAGYYCREVFAISGIGAATEITRITGTGANGMGMYVRVTVNGHSSATGNGMNYKGVRYDGGTTAVTQVETATSGTVPPLTFNTSTNNVLIINLATGGAGGTTFNGVMVVEWHVPIDFSSATWTVS